jgi:hypothetical protein
MAHWRELKSLLVEKRNELLETNSGHYHAIGKSSSPPTTHHFTILINVAIKNVLNDNPGFKVSIGADPLEGRRSLPESIADCKLICTVSDNVDPHSALCRLTG